MNMLGGSGGGNKVVATLRADGKVYPTEGCINNFANLINYKIRTEGELNKSVNTLSVTTTVVDLGKQLLQYARDSDVNGVKTMLSRGAPFTSDWLGMSALHFAAMNNQYEICDMLLKGGINKDSKTKVDRTPLHLACFYGHERIVVLLLEKKCAINPSDMLRMTPIHWAVEKRHKNIVRLLIQHSADVTLLSKFGKTPIALAVLTEQADLLEDLEAARQTQISRKYNEQHEKETSDAVNSIMGMSSDVIEEPDAIRKIDMDTEDEFPTDADYPEAKITNLENIKETGIFDNSTINLLKSHGISMMQDDDDASKHLLNTALQNGRQLVLSEGGKMLLNETKKIQSNNNNNNTLGTHNNNSNAMVPVRMKNDANAPGTVPHINLSSKIRPNIISKAKDNPGMAKNKNIRIISLNDFKKLYGNTNIKAMQKIPASLANSRLVKQLVEDAKVETADRKMYVNVRQSHQSEKLQRIVETVTINEGNAESMDDFDPMSNIIQVGASDSEAELSDSEQTIKSTLPVRFIPAKRVEHIGPVQMRQMTNAPTTTTTTSSSSSSNLKQVAGAYKQTETKSANLPAQPTVGSSTATTSTSSVIPLLTTPEICRQLLELRKQNEELRRKFDLAQKEKEEMRQRLERLEELLLVEKTDEDYTES